MITIPLTHDRNESILGRTEMRAQQFYVSLKSWQTSQCGGGTVTVSMIGCRVEFLPGSMKLRLECCNTIVLIGKHRTLGAHFSVKLVIRSDKGRRSNLQDKQLLCTTSLRSSAPEKEGIISSPVAKYKL